MPDPITDSELLKTVFNFEDIEDLSERAYNKDVMMWNMKNIPQYKLHIEKLAKFRVIIDADTGKPILRKKINLHTGPESGKTFSPGTEFVLSVKLRENESLDYGISSKNQIQVYTKNGLNAHEVAHAADFISYLLVANQPVTINGGQYYHKEWYNKFQDLKENIITEYDLGSGTSAYNIYTNSNIPVEIRSELHGFAEVCLGIFGQARYDRGQANLENIAMQYGEKPFSAVTYTGYIENYRSAISIGYKLPEIRQVVANKNGVILDELVMPDFTGETTPEEAKIIIENYSLDVSEIFSPEDLICVKTLDAPPVENCFNANEQLLKLQRKRWADQVNNEDFTNVNVEEEKTIQKVMDNLMKQFGNDGDLSLEDISKIQKTALSLRQIGNLNYNYNLENKSPGTKVPTKAF